MIRRGADKRQAECDVDAIVETERLGGDQRLVVIHADRHIVGGTGGGRGTSYRPEAGRPISTPSAFNCSMTGRMMASSSRPERPAFAGMRIEPGNG